MITTMKPLNQNKMKNIHVLATDQPSRLWINNLRRRLELDTDVLIGSNTAQHIYITSDEEPKKGNWVLHKNTLYTVKINKGLYLTLDGLNHIDVKSDICKKIILTTDQDIIKDGVQAIDDEFLEWFVKNPSCEEVEVDTRLKVSSHFEKGFVIDNPNYNKIIIPKEEPKDVVLGYKTSLDAQMLNRIEPKQETLEEAGKDYIENTMRFSFNSLETKTQANRMLKCVEFGAKWQQEQILQFLYSEIIERRPYSSSKMCEVVIEFIKQLNTKK